MKPAQLRDMSLDELAGKEQELREELFNLSVQHATGQLENTARIRIVKKDIARVLTARRARVDDQEVEHA